MWLAVDGRTAGLLGVTDPIKPTTEAPAAGVALAALGEEQVHAALGRLGHRRGVRFSLT